MARVKFEDVHATLQHSNLTSTTETSVWADVDLAQAVPVGVILSCIILATAMGNILVVTAVVKDQKLHSLSNRLVASLAITDMMVSLLVLPLSASSVVLKKWPFGEVMCDFFITIDVLLCTNSILHLVAIAIDRYLTVTDITYGRGNKKYRHIFPVMVLASWLVAAAVSLPPYFVDLTKNTARNSDEEHCIISQDKAYTILSTMSAFYLPSAIIILIYIRIFFVVRANVNKSKFRKNTPAPKLTTMTTINMPEDKEKPPNELSPLNGGDQLQIAESPNSESSTAEGADAEEVLSTETSSSSHQCCNHDVPSVQFEARPLERKKSSVLRDNTKRLRAFLANSTVKTQLVTRHNREKRPSMLARKKKAQKRERKALRTLLIITGIFISCWTPFFIFAVTMPFCGDWCVYNVPVVVGDLVTWLGYSNSMLNPIIYTIFSPDFRTAFRKILRC